VNDFMRVTRERRPEGIFETVRDWRGEVVSGTLLRPRPEPLAPEQAQRNREWLAKFYGGAS
jgi:hypothetical protein